MKINKTFNYDLFSFYSFNRKVRKSATLEKSIKNLDLTEYNPIVVSPDHFIIDGQHRFEACKKLGLPIYYVICDKNPEKAVTSLNTAGSYWRQEEWLQYYVGKGLPNYVKLRKLMDDTGCTNLSNATTLFSGDKTNSKGFKKGKLYDNSAYFVPVMNFLSDIPLDNRTKNYRPFISALRYFFEKYYDTDKRKINKLHKKLPAIASCRNVDDYLRAFEQYARQRG